MRIHPAVTFVAFAAAAAGAFAAAEPPPFVIEVNPRGEVIKDISKSTTAPDLGLSGEMGGTFADLKLSYVDCREETARAFRESGVWLVRPCGMVGLFEGIGKNPGAEWKLDKNGRCSWIHPRHIFSFWKEYGIKAIICLNLWNGEEKNKRLLSDFLAWIRENGYEDLVGGFEMCNEPFYGKDPEGFAAYWKELIAIIRAAMPKVKIGLPLAEYVPGDPDIAAAKARLLGEGKLSSDYFKANNLNRWSARVVKAMGDELTNVTHVIYHVYGAAGAYGCSYSGFQRFRNFAKMFPEVADKRWWITEWRPWSDENLQLQRKFHYAIWSAMYAQTAFCQPELDGFTMHELTSLSGVFYVSCNGKWGQYYDSWENGRDLKRIRGNTQVYEQGCIGAVFSLYTQAAITHPLVVGFGGRISGSGHRGVFWASAGYEAKGAKDGNCQWTALVNPHRSSMCLMVANGTNERLETPVSCYGYRLLSKTHRFITCDAEYVNMREVPGEEKPWRRLNWEQESNGDPRREQKIVIPPRSVGTVMIGLKKWDEWWRVHIGRQLVNEAVKAAKAKAPKGAAPSVECCGVARGKLFMILPDGYPGHPEVKENLPARKLCEEIGRDPKKLDDAAIERARNEGFSVSVDAPACRVWIFRAKDVPSEDASSLERRLREMAGF